MSCLAATLDLSKKIKQSASYDVDCFCFIGCDAFVAPCVSNLLDVANCLFAFGTIVRSDARCTESCQAEFASFDDWSKDGMQTVYQIHSA